jgi:type IV pilus assembly protein PilM
MGFIDLFAKSSPKNTGAPRVVGIDIGTSSIKVVELQERSGVVTLTTYGELQLGPYEEGKTVGQSVTLTPNLERQALVDVLRESAVKARQAVLAMPLSASFVTVMTLQAAPREDISSRVRVEARKYIPVPIAEVALDWAEVETRAGVADTARDILLAAIQNDALKRFTTLMQTVEFSNPPTEIECFSTIRSIYSGDEPDVAIIDIGATSCKLYLIRSGLLQRMYRVRAGGVIATERAVAEGRGTFEEIEALKRSVTREQSAFTFLQKIHHAQYDRVFKEFKQVIEEYEARVGVTIPQIVLTGGGSLFPGLDVFTAHHFNREVRYASPFDKVAYPAFMEDTLRQIGPTFTPALGAALRLFE